MRPVDHRAFFEDGGLHRRTSRIPAIARRDLRAHRETTSALRRRVATDVTSRYPDLSRWRRVSMRALMDRVDQRFLRHVIECIDKVMFGGRIDTRSIRLFIEDGDARDRSPGAFVDYAMTEWGGDEPAHITLYLDAFLRTHRVFQRGCRKLVDGIPCSTPLEFLICVLSHELVHVVVGHMQGFKGAHTERFRSLNVLVNGAKRDEVTNRSCCGSSCSESRLHDR